MKSRHLRTVGRYGHRCPHTGTMQDEKTPDFYRCRCFRVTADFLAHQDAAAVRADFRRGTGAR